MNLWEGLTVCRRGVSITHFQYADDTILFCPPNIEYLQNMKKTFILFHLASELQVNFYKGSIMGLNVSNNWLDSAAKTLVCKKGSLPFTYLGLPIGGSSSRHATWEPVIQRIERKLASWRGKMLSIGGRLTLIKSSLSNLPLYYMSIFPIPSGVIDKISALQRRFLWSGNIEKNAMALVKWDVIQKPKQMVASRLVTYFTGIWLYCSNGC